MTLVVARRVGDSITIVSDTRISKASREKIDHLGGAIIKSVVFSPYMALSFAGDERTAGQTILKLNEGFLNFDRSQIVDSLLADHILSKQIPEGTTDFIIAFHRPTRLVCIKDGAASDCDAAWIGDKNGFNVFQENYLLDRAVKPSLEGGSKLNHDSNSGYFTAEFSLDDGPLSLAHKMRNAMQTAIDEADIESVGGFPILLVSPDGYFQYGEYLSFHTSRMDLEEFNELEVLPIGDVAGGTFTLYCSSTDNGSICFPALYSVEGKIGILFGTSKSGVLRSIGLRAWSFEEFLCRLEDEFGLRCPSQLPGAEDLKDISRSMTVRASFSDKGRVLWEPMIHSKSSVATTRKRRPRLTTGNYEIVVCESAFGRPELETAVLRLFAQGKWPHFFHIGTGDRLTVGELFRRTVFQQNQMTGLVAGEQTTRFAYLIFDLSSNDRYVLETTGGRRDLARLIIKGTVAAK